MSLSNTIILEELVCNINPHFLLINLCYVTEGSSISNQTRTSKNLTLTTLDPFFYLPPGGYSLRTRIRTTLHYSGILVENNTLSIPHHCLPVVSYLNLMTQLTQRLYSF